MGVGLSLGLAACSSQRSAPKTADSTTLLQRIPASDPSKQCQPRASRGWPNPFLVIREDGIGLVDRSNNEERILKTSEVLDALAQLPLSAWPCGRVIAVQDQGLASEPQRIAIRRNRGILVGTMAELNITIVWAPN